tara:strand:+ start:450 stop:755 length:306 start_codon:yes stop_codon:yes gene_type:complete
MPEISDKQLREMERQISKLNALEAAGVDNWVHYDDALEGWNRENAREEAIDILIGEFHETLTEADVDQPAGPDAGYSIHVDDSVLRNFILLVETKLNEAKE